MDGQTQFSKTPSGHSPRLRWWVLGVVTAFTASLYGVVAFRGRLPTQLPTVSTPAVTPAMPADNPHGYLGPDACASCHAQRVAEFRATRHFQACVLPQAAMMPAGFAPGKGTFTPRGSPVRFEMTRVKDEFLQTAVRSTPGGEQTTSSPIALVYGAGAGTDEVYFTWHGDRLHELPMSWLHPTGEWSTSGFDRDGADDFSRPTSPRCMECHNSWLEHVPGTVNQYKRETLILGVTCEACHGPGSDHVNYHRSHPDARSGQFVVHPGRLSRELQMDLCAQCHSNAIKHRGPAFSYRPGQPLDAHYKTLTTKHPEDDHVANQVTYLRESKCFQKSDSLTCTTCHNPHQAISLPDRGTGQSACMTCHQPADCGERERLPVALQENCVGCHMPKGNKIQVNFDTANARYFPPVPRWEHRIAVHPIARDEILLAWHRTQTDAPSQEFVARLTTSLVDYWLMEAERCRGEFRFIAAIEAYRQALQLEDTSATRDRLNEVVAIQTALEFDMTKVLHLMEQSRFDEALEMVQRILALKPDHAKAHGRLGTLYAVKGQNELAAEHWQAVAKYDPDDQYGESMLGWQAYLQGRPEEALNAYERAEAIEPYVAKIQYHMGLVLAKLERWPDAIARFRKALIIEPNHLEAALNLNFALRSQNQQDEALRVITQAAQTTREEHLEVLVVLAETYAEMGRFKDAEDTATKMLKIARSRHPDRLPEIHRRKAEWHSRSKQETKP